MPKSLELAPRIEEQRNKNEVKFRIVEFDLNEIKSHVEIRLIDDAIKNPESYDWLLEYINEKIKREVYISLESMKDQLNLLGIKFEDVINIAFNNKFNPERNQLNGKQIIQELFIRRNEIAHQSDRNHYNAEQNDISKEYVLNGIENVKNIVSAIHNIAVKKKNE